MSGEYGCLPFMRGLPKTQSSTSENGDSSDASATAESVIISGIIGQPLTQIRGVGGLVKTMLADEYARRRCQFARILPSCRRRSYQLVLLRTSFGFQPNCHPSLPILSRRKSAPLSEEERRFTFEKSDVYANPYPLRLFADRLGNSSDPAVTVRTNLSSSRILVLDPVLSRLLYFGAFAFILLSHSHL